MRPVKLCAGWLLAFCAVLISPAILIYSAPLTIGAGADLVQASAAAVAHVFWTGPASLAADEDPHASAGKLYAMIAEGFTALVLAALFLLPFVAGRLREALLRTATRCNNAGSMGAVGLTDRSSHGLRDED